ncbi:hypothetical protein HNY73_000369 [Argiope bruennichi]|uniref:Tesmin/TSO1-like CXC domain-containing protein n=1 Tax=Argiope bruennichi TaxID=94029 RepID=A0A8T0FYV8_ARGBR|nr:hypothetical protein HNY73_000369 [Argiope bruennichi]
MNQPTFIQNSQVINANNLKSTPTQFGQVLAKVNSESANKSDCIAKQKVLIVNKSNKAESSSSTSVTDSSVSNIKYQTIPQVYLPYTTLVNSTDGANQVRVQYLNKIPVVNNTINIPVSVNNLVSTSTVPTTVSNTSISSIPNSNFYSAVKSFGVKEQITNLKLDSKPKVTQSKCRQPILKPIKNIPLGKDKYAIQQISTPVPICGNEELNNSLGYYSNVNKINEKLFLEKSNFDNKSGSRINNNASEALEKNTSNFRNTLTAIPNKNFIQQNETLPNTNFTSTSVTTSSIGSVKKNTNLQEKCQISATNSVNVNVVPVSKTLQINKSVSALNTIQTTNSKDKQSASNFNLNTTNSLVPMNGNSQNKSLATLQELFPPPISMVPVCVLPQTQSSQDTNQAGPSKVLILNGNGKEQTVTHKLKIDPIPYRERSISKKAKEKLKKGRLKTVRELLQERRKSCSNQSRNKVKQGISVKEQESEHFAESSVSENMEDSLSSYTSSAFDKKDNRPRHYDMSQLNIGDFRVDDDIDSCGRFRSKFKVIFSKRQFYYDFPVSRCNQYSLKSTDAWEQMARIAVPFKTIVTMMIESDCTWGCMIRSSFHHKIILRKKQANKVKSFLCHFDDRFLNIINVSSLCENGINSVDELSIFDGERSPTTLKQNIMKNKKHYIRRLSHWDSSENEDQKTVDEDDLVLLNQMCSCRVSCRSIRCSCVKAAKSCNSVCDCINCDNPLNILETLGMNLDFSLSDSCLFQNIYQIPKLVTFPYKRSEADMLQYFCPCSRLHTRNCSLPQCGL